MRSGYFQLAYEDDGCTEYEIGDRHFIQWMQENHSEFVSEVREELLYNGTMNTWCYITTNVEIQDERWQSWLEEFESI